MIVRVYHVSQEVYAQGNFGGFEVMRSYIPVFDEDYEFAAALKLDDILTSEEALQQAYEKTNNIDHFWWDNPEVIEKGTDGRSTSIGDVVEIRGQKWRCLPVGWEKMN